MMVKSRATWVVKRFLCSASSSYGERYYLMRIKRVQEIRTGTADAISTVHRINAEVKKAESKKRRTTKRRKTKR